MSRSYRNPYAKELREDVKYSLRVVAAKKGKGSVYKREKVRVNELSDES